MSIRILSRDEDGFTAILDEDPRPRRPICRTCWYDQHPDQSPPSGQRGVTTEQCHVCGSTTRFSVYVRSAS